MSSRRLGVVLKHIYGATDGHAPDEPTDRELLEKFIAGQDDAAFAALMRRHGAMVLSVCRRVLGHQQDAEDACQATFLVLARKAGSVRWKDCVGNWLHGTAYRIANNARVARARQRAKEQASVAKGKRDEKPASCGALSVTLDEELQHLSEKYRAPVVLCYLEGQSQSVAAARLGISEGTLKRRLASARQYLSQRLASRGVRLTGALLALGLADGFSRAALPPTLTTATLKMATAAAAGKTLLGISNNVLSLAGVAMDSTTFARMKLSIALVLALTIIAGAGILAKKRFAELTAGSDKPLPQAKGSSADRDSADADALPERALARLGVIRMQQEGGVAAIAFSPDGKILATGGGNGFVPTTGTITLWDATTGTELRKLSPDVRGHVTKLAFSRDGKILLAQGLITNKDSTFRGAIRLFDVSSGNEVHQRDFGDSGSGYDTYGFALSPDGEFLAQCIWWQNNEKKGMSKIRLYGSVKYKDPQTGEDREASGELGQWDGESGGPYAIVFTKDNKLLACANGGKDNKTVHLELSKEEIKVNDGTPDGKKVVQFSLKAATGKGSGAGFDDAHFFCTAAASFSPDGKLAVVPGADNDVTIWDLSTGSEVTQLKGSTTKVRSAIFSPDGHSVAALTEDRSAWVWDVKTGRGHEWKKAWNPFIFLGTFAFSADSKSLAVGYHFGNGTGGVRMFDAVKGLESGPNPGHQAALAAVASSIDGKTVATCQGDAIRIWDVSAMKEIRSFTEDGGAACIGVSSDGKNVLSVDKNGTLRVRDTGTGKELSKFELPLEADTAIQRACFSADGKFVAAAALKKEKDGEPRIIHWAVWNVADGKRLHADSANSNFNGDETSSAALSADGRLLAIGVNSQVRIWNASDGKELKWKTEPKEHSGDGRGSRFNTSPLTLASAVAFSPDGHYLAATGGYFTNRDNKQARIIRLYELVTGEACSEFVVPASNQYQVDLNGSLAFSPDGRALAAWSQDEIHVFDLPSANELPVLRGHRGFVSGLAFSGDGKRLVTGSYDTTALVWDMARLMPTVQKTARSKGDIQDMWDRLGDDDAKVAYQAGWELRQSTPESIALLGRRLRPAQAPPEAKRIAGLIADLDADDFDKRGQAYEDLADVGAEAESALRRALHSGPSLESRVKLEKLLSRVDRMTPDRLRQRRALEALERCSTPEARKFLKALAEAEPGAWLTDEAKTTLERLDKRAAASP
jgi:RNA polymerase sigma factor (sigma-70 family)